MAEPYPHCPYARLGLDSEGMRRCAGFFPADVGIISIEPWLMELRDVEGVTCRHLGVQESDRGFVSACLFPGGVPDQPPPTLLGPGHPTHHPPTLIPGE